MRQCCLREEEGAAAVDLLHEVVLLRRQLLGRFGSDRACIVDAHIDAAESLDGGVDGALHVLFFAYVADDGDGLTAGCLDVATAVWTVPFNLGWGSAVLARSTTFAPCAAAATAIASPMPRLAPDTTIVRSRSACWLVIVLPDRISCCSFVLTDDIGILIFCK